MDDNILVLTGEDGREHEFELLAVIPYQGVDYAVLAPAWDEEIEEVLILQFEEEDGEDILVTVESDEAFQAVFELFNQQLEE